MDLKRDKTSGMMQKGLVPMEKLNPTALDRARSPILERLTMLRERFPLEGY